MPAQTGKLKGRYELKEPIGHGGMGVVYRAFDSVVKRDVAVKTLRDTPSREALQLFQKECKVLASLSHPNIVEIFDIGEFEEDGHRKPFFVMPFLPGLPLDKLIRTEGHRLTPERSVEILQQACRGLHAGHESGLVHRDVKPSNIFVMKDDSVKIIDFGVAHMMDSGFSRTQKGTLRYMAPEQIENKPLSPSSDIFSLAVVAYETLTGRWPFEHMAETEDEIVNVILYQTPPPASDINPAVSQTLSRVIHKALAKQPWHRFSSAQEFSDTLRRAVHDEPIDLFDPARLQPRIQRARKAFEEGDSQFAAEIVGGLEAEGHLDPEITRLHREIDQAIRQRTIQQLLESAWIRFEEDEYPLALQKIQDILRLDPENAGALGLKNTIENKRVERKVEDWFRVAQQHLSNNAYGHARQALQNVLQLRKGDPRAEQLLTEVSRREQEYQEQRRKKEAAYKLARAAWENGEISTALSKMEWILSLEHSNPDSKASDQTTLYQTFYQEVRSAYEAMNGAYNEARKQLDARNFAKALESCDTWLRRFPGQALFQALKFDIEEQQRRERSVFIAEVDRRVDAETDLEKRVGIIKEALERFPDEVHFKEALRHARDKYRLFSTIVEKARFYEERGQYSEALGQWEMLRNIHTQYPGLEYEIERVGKRREEQERREAKERWIQRLQQELRGGGYRRVLELVKEAQGEFPGDRELGEIEARAQQGAERAKQVEVLLGQGQELRQQGRYDEAITALGQAHNLEEGNTVVRSALGQTLAEQARGVVEKDWALAEKWIEQALRVDPGQGLAKSLRVRVLERKRQELVVLRLERSRQLREAGDLKGAQKELQQGLAEFPDDPNLKEEGARLTEEIQRQEPRPQPIPASSPPLARGGERKGSLRVVRSTAEPPKKSPVLSSQQSATERLQKARTTPIEQLQLAAEKLPWVWVKRAWILDGAVAVLLAVLFVVIKVVERSPKPIPPAADIAIEINILPPGAKVSVNGVDHGILPQGRLSMPPGNYELTASKDGYRAETIPFQLKPDVSPAPINLSLQPLPSGLRIYTDLSGGMVSIDQQPPSKVKDGQLVVDSLEPGKHTVTVSEQAMKAAFEFEVEPGMLPVLTAPPEANELRAIFASTFGGQVHVQLSFPSSVTLDQQEYPDPKTKEINQDNLIPGTHQLVIGKGGDLLTKDIENGPSPTLTVYLQSDRKVGSLVLSTNEDGYRIFLNEKERSTAIKRGTARIENLSVGSYVVRVSKEGFASDPQQLSVQIRKGQDSKLLFTLKPLPKFAVLRIEKGQPGSSILFDDKPLGTMSDDGTFEAPNINPGSHEVKLRKEGYKPRSETRTFFAGRREIFNGSLEKVTLLGTLIINVTPPAENLTIANGQGTSWRVTRVQNELQAGKYVVTAQWQSSPAPVKKEVEVVAGATQTLNLELPKGGMASWENPKEWLAEGQWFVHQGGNAPVLFGLKPVGKFRFTARAEKGNHITWLADYKDVNNYVRFEIDKKNFTRTQFTKGTKGLSFSMAYGMEKDRVCQLEVEVTQSAIVTRVYDRPNNAWKVLDKIESPAGGDFTAGRFGLEIPPKEAVALSQFSFDPE